MFMKDQKKANEITANLTVKKRWYFRAILFWAYAMVIINHKKAPAIADRVAARGFVYKVDFSNGKKVKL